MKRLAVLVSGTGTIMRSILENNIPVVAVIADRPCAALDHLWATGNTTRFLIARTDYIQHGVYDRASHTAAIERVLVIADVDFVMMAGYMSILHESIFARFRGKIINTHPSLLPAFKGDTAVRDALAYGVKVTGCTMHYATEILDEGPIIDQRVVEVRENDTEESLHERIKVRERQMVPYVLKRLMAE